MFITITDRARDQIKEMLKEEPANTWLRFGVEGGGCSGLSYKLGFEEEDEVNKELDLTEEINDIPVVIKKMDVPIIENTEIDFKENLMGGGFAINNPNAIFSCGCGSSFRTEQAVGTPGDC